jgi:hypothetical protein
MKTLLRLSLPEEDWSPRAKKAGWWLEDLEKVGVYIRGSTEGWEPDSKETPDIAVSLFKLSFY